MSQVIGMNSTTGLSTSSESVDDIPLLVAHLQRLGMQRLIDAHFTSQQTYSEVSVGWVALIWLAHILSQSGRQARHVRSWVGTHPETLFWLTGQSVSPTDISDNRMRDILRLLDDDATWEPFELALNQHIARSYRLHSERIRLSRSAGLWYITSEGALQFDQGRRWWPGAMQVHLNIATIDGTGLPTTVWVAPSEAAAATPVEAIMQSRGALAGQRITFIGNGELSSPVVRAAIHAGSDEYLCLLSRDDALAELGRVRMHEHNPTNRDWNVIADMYERTESIEAEFVGRPLAWVERRLLTRSHRQADLQADDLMLRLARAQRELLALNERKRGKRRPRTLIAMQEAAELILEEYGLTGLLRLHFEELVDSRTVRRYRGRPTTTRVDRLVTISSSVDEDAVLAARERLGWQIYATTMTAADLPLDQVSRMGGEPVMAFERLRGRTLSLLPGIIQRSDHVRGLVRLLGIGLRALALIDMAAQSHAADLPGIVWQRPGAQMPTGNPSAERLLEIFADITLTSVSDGHGHGYHLTSLSSLQRRIIDWLSLSKDTYHAPNR